jgi:chemotaxis signal transduction protein
LAHRVPAAQSEEYVTCKLSRGRCLIPQAALYEVVRPPHRFTVLPVTPHWMLGLVAWRGETIAAIDLDAYLSDYPADFPNEGMLLIANHESYTNLPLGLLVPTIEEQTTPLQPADQAGRAESAAMSPFTDNSMHMLNQASADAVDEATTWYLPSRAAFVKGVQAEALVLDVPLLLADMVQQIEIAASYG